MRIVEYINHDNITVEFQDDYKFRKKSMYTNFRTGSIKNPYDRTVFSIGYIGDGEYMAKRNKKPTREYHCWQNMLERCYFEKNADLHKSYFGLCEVCDEWLNFHTFAK